MRYRKVLLCLVSVCLSTVVSAKTELPSNKSQFINLFNTKVGSYQLVSGDAKMCAGGQLAWLDANEPDLGFKLGDKIIFNNLHHGTQTNKVANFCLVTTKYKYTTQSITMSLRHTRCENEIDNVNTSQMLRFISPTILAYSIESSNVRCQFELQL
ncbi:hypothetical protein HHO47_02250 [Pseudoalteromonas arctica]|uniref:Orphan protein n=2 Tax=Pseudoalteromonas arctica TaxID=394751 RepID=A0A7Y0DQB2_9GAMM|nr:hypothetical protein [Pseudoalteromonas arctica]NMM39687.1 hypothetical protein [Pseudoalteromonas arctica]